MKSEREKNYGGSSSKQRARKQERQREHLEELVFLPFVFRNASFLRLQPYVTCFSSFISASSSLVFLFHFSKKTAAISSSDLQPPPLYFSILGSHSPRNSQRSRRRVFEIGACWRTV
ncbi:hypothetical protein ERO13_D11G079250v2 [Gossypium hirsutum]|nr:hypothetical protein ERO13_D11G079250v2 [Gossypium hirsutum]